MKMGEDLRFDGRVALVTGAGGGLGKEYALLLAARGASVVVNDLGGDRAGQGKSSMAADKVVNEIRSKGGKAVANYDSVEDGDKLVQTALDNFGRIDIVINNAGILRDRSFARISDMDWDLVHRVHLRGSFMVTRAAWPHMKKQKFGRIIMTSSAAGLYGNFGQTNYSAAKLGLVGMSNTLSREGVKYNILCNTIAPVAASRLTEDIMPPDIFEKLKPDYVAPMVAYLSHEECQSTGGIYECGAGWAAKLRWQRTAGVNCLKPDQPYTAEQIRDNWDKICDFEGKVSYPASTQDSMMFMLESMNEESSDADSSPSSKGDTGGDGDEGGFNPSKAIGVEMEAKNFEYTSREAILYALGVGVSTTQPDHLKFLFELNEDFCVLPTFGVIPSFAALQNLTSVPGLESIDVTRILHGEQYLELKKPLDTSAKLTNKPMVVDIVDKKSGAVIIINANSYDENNELVIVNQNVVFLVGAGGFGGKRSSPHLKETAKAPSRAPDASLQEKTSLDQAALYRLSGDYNPLHIDPSFAAMGGFAQPILHGLCSFGFASRHVLKQYANNDVSKFKAIKVRFSKPVLPGQTIQTDMWQEGTRIHFQSKVVETGAVCISGAYVDLHGVAEQKNAPGSRPSSSSGLKSEAIFSAASGIVSGSPDLVKKVNGVIQYNITSNGKVAGVWTIDLKGQGAVYVGEPKSGKANVTVTISDADFVALASGSLKPQTAFMSGKIKVKGQIMLLQKVLPMFESFLKGKL